MKTSFFLILFAMVLIIVHSCSKSEGIANTSPLTMPPSPPLKPSGMLVGNKEFFWGKQWDTSATEYKINLETWRLTQEAINKGVDVYVSLSPGMSPWDQIPKSIPDPFFTDTIHLSFTVVPEKVQVLARSNAELKAKEADFYIEYK